MVAAWGGTIWPKDQNVGSAQQEVNAPKVAAKGSHQGLKVLVHD